MRAVLLGVDEGFLAERERLGQHRLDECWEGEWHLVNPPRMWHNLLNSGLFRVLVILGERRGLVGSCEATGVFAADDDWRVPDQVHCRPDDLIEAGVTSAELVVEVRSPGDDSYAKLPFYAARGVTEVLIVHEDRRVELYRRRDDVTMVQIEHPDGSATSDVLGCTFTRVDGPRLLVTWDDGSAEL